MRKQNSDAAPLSEAAPLVLIIEDDEEVRQITGEGLRLAGFSVIDAPDGERGVQRFQRSHAAVHLILLDVSLPGLSGAETLIRLRLIAPTVPIVLTSGFGPAALSEAMLAQSNAFLSKPYRLRDLTGMIRDILAATEQDTGSV